MDIKFAEGSESHKNVYKSVLEDHLFDGTDRFTEILKVNFDYHNTTLKIEELSVDRTLYTKIFFIKVNCLRASPYGSFLTSTLERVDDILMISND